MVHINTRSTCSAQLFAPTGPGNASIAGMSSHTPCLTQQRCLYKFAVPEHTVSPPAILHYTTKYDEHNAEASRPQGRHDRRGG